MCVGDLQFRSVPFAATGLECGTGAGPVSGSAHLEALVFSP